MSEPSTTDPQKPTSFFNVKRNVIAGILSAIPIWVTWIVFSFIFNQLSSVGTPWADLIADTIAPSYPTVAGYLKATWFRYVLSVSLTLLALYLLGLLTAHVVGKKLLAVFETLLNRIPFVQSIYGGTKKMLSALQTNPENIKRVVLINFPSEHMKTIGFVTTTLRDEVTQRELAAVYVPTTPNPTSGYLEIVPVEDLVPTDWGVDEAMTFIVSGGVVSPGEISFSNAKPDLKTD